MLGKETYDKDYSPGNAIRQVLKNAGRPLSPQEIFNMSQREVTGLGIATVYRNLKSLQEEGAVIQSNYRAAATLGTGW